MSANNTKNPASPRGCLARLVLALRGRWRKSDLAGPVYDGPKGPVGMPGPMGPNADGTPGETEEENLQRWRDAIEHNERFFASQNTQDRSRPTCADETSPAT
jgi:hypothetical protein